MRPSNSINFQVAALGIMRIDFYTFHNYYIVLASIFSAGFLGKTASININLSGRK